MKYLISLFLFFPVWAFAQNSEQQLPDSIKYKKAAIAAFNNKDYKSCMDDYNIFIKLNPKNINAYANRASAKTYLKDYEGAIIDYIAAAKLDERYRWTYYNSIGILKLSENDFKGAIDYYNKSISIYPNAGTFSNRGHVWIQLGKYKRAIKDYTKAIDLENLDTGRTYANRFRSHPYTARAKAEALNGDFKKALVDFNTGVRLNPDDAGAYNGRGEAKNQLGDKAGACTDWQIASNLGSDAAKENIKNYCGK